MQSNQVKNDRSILDFLQPNHQTAHYESFPAILPNPSSYSRAPRLHEWPERFHVFPGVSLVNRQFSDLGRQPREFRSWQHSRPGIRVAELLERRELLATFTPGDIVVERIGDGS